MQLEDAMELSRYISEQGWIAMDALEQLGHGYDITDLVDEGEFAPENIGHIAGVLNTLNHSFGVDTSDALANLATFDQEAYENA